MSYFVYVIYADQFDKIYIGMTSNTVLLVCLHAEILWYYADRYFKHNKIRSKIYWVI